MIRTLTLQPKRHGLYPFTHEVEKLVREAGIAGGLAHFLFAIPRVKHRDVRMPRAQDAQERPACDPQRCRECRKGAWSARDLIQENTDPTVRSDLERWLNRLVPENDPLYQHTLEGEDDLPAHTTHKDVGRVARAPGVPTTQCGTDRGQPEYSHH